MKQPLSCSFLKIARLSAIVTGMFLSLVGRAEMGTCRRER
jgi:hypothetical protein